MLVHCGIAIHRANCLVQLFTVYLDVSHKSGVDICQGVRLDVSQMLLLCR